MYLQHLVEPKYDLNANFKHAQANTSLSIQSKVKT